MSWVSLSDRILINHPQSVIQKVAKEVFLIRRNGQYVVCCKHCRCVTIPTHFYQASYWCRHLRIRRVLELLPFHDTYDSSQAEQRAIAERSARLPGDWQSACRHAIREATGRAR